MRYFRTLAATIDEDRTHEFDDPCLQPGHANAQSSPRSVHQLPHPLPPPRRYATYSRPQRPPHFATLLTPHTATPQVHHTTLLAYTAMVHLTDRAFSVIIKPFTALRRNTVKLYYRFITFTWLGLMQQSFSSTSLNLSHAEHD